MKKQFKNRICVILISASLLVSLSVFSYGQKNTSLFDGQNPKSLLDEVLKNADYKYAWSAIEKMRQEHIDDYKIIA